MSIEQKLIDRINELEEDKTNEGSPEDLSNIAFQKITDENAKIEEMIDKFDLSEEEGDKLQESFHRDLQQIHDSLNGEIGFLKYQVEKEIGGIDQESLSQIHGILDEDAFAKLLELIHGNYNFNVKYLLRIHDKYKEIKIQDIIDTFYKYPNVSMYALVKVKLNLPKEDLDAAAQFILKHGQAYQSLSYIKESFANITLDELLGWIERLPSKDIDDIYDFPYFFPDNTIEEFLTLLEDNSDITEKQIYGLVDFLGEGYSVDEVFTQQKLYPGVDFGNYTYIQGLFPETTPAEAVKFKEEHPYIDRYDIGFIKDVLTPELRKELEQNPGNTYAVINYVRYAYDPDITGQEVLGYLKSQNMDIGDTDVLKKRGYSFEEYHYYLYILGRIVPKQNDTRKYDNNPRGLLDDLAIYIFLDILESGWLPTATFEDRLIVARNIAGSNTIFSKDGVEYHYSTLIESREANVDTMIFKDRNIILAGHHEDIPDEYGGGERFLKPEFINAVRKQGGKIDEDNIYRPENTPESLLKAKKGVLEAIEETPSPMTFVFSGHGSSDGIYFSDGDYVDGNQNQVHMTPESIFISYEELAEAYAQRHKKLGIPNKRNIMIIDACMSFTYLMRFYDKLIKEGVSHESLPICISQSEYEQLGYSDFDSEYGNKFFEMVLGVRYSDHITTIGDIMKNGGPISPYDGDGRTNPSVFIPYDNEGKDFIQIVENENHSNTKAA